MGFDFIRRELRSSWKAVLRCQQYVGYHIFDCFTFLCLSIRDLEVVCEGGVCIFLSRCTEILWRKVD